MIWTAVIWTVGALPLLVRMVGVQFLPSVQWYQDARWIALGVGCFTGVIGTLVVSRSLARNEPDGLSMKSIAVVIFSPFFSGMIGMDAASVGFPMLYTSVFGVQGEQHYVVARAEGFSDRKCRNRIRLRQTPALYSKLCGFSEEFRNSLRPGMQIVVLGRSSKFGVFVARARAVQPIE